MIWLLRLEWAGRTWYLASRSCAPVLDGVEVPHLGTLTVGGYVEAVDMGGGITGPCSASVSFILGGPEDIHTMVLQGHHLDTMRGELSLWSPDRTYAQRWVLLWGAISADTIPDAGQPIEGSLAQALVQSAADYPPASAVASVETWSTLPVADEGDDSEGVVYPVPIGDLGLYTRGDATTNGASAVPVIIVDDTPGAEVGAIALGDIDASSVTIYESEVGTEATFTPSTTTDDLGQLVTVVSFAAAPGPWTVDGTVDLYVTDMVSGIPSVSGLGPIRGLGDAALHLLLQRYGDEGPELVDVGRWVAAFPWLKAFIVGFTLVERADPLDAIADKLGSFSPLLWIMPGPRGYRPVYMADVDASSCLHLEIGRNCDESEDSEWGYLDIDPLTSVVVKFAQSIRTSKFRGRVTTDRERHPLAAAGYTRHGERAETIEIASYDRGTAGLVGAEHIRARWTRPIYGSIVVEAADAERIDLGAKVRFTDARRGIDARPMYVQGREVGEDPGRWTITLIGWW
jgi:hypothetical protein